jgi:hypothetical protein
LASDECEEDGDGDEDDRCIMAMGKGDDEDERKMRAKIGRGTARWVLENCMDKLSLNGIEGEGGNAVEMGMKQSMATIRTKSQGD